MITGVSGSGKSTLAYRHDSMPGGMGDSSDDTPGGRMQLGTWQQITFIDPGNRPSDRKLLVQIVGG